MYTVYIYIYKNAKLNIPPQFWKPKINKIRVSDEII